MSFHNDAALEALTEVFDDVDDFFTTVVFESSVSVAMTWVVTEQDQERLEAGWNDDNKKAVDRLVQWWGKRHTPKP
jgi:hypothetical protein